MRLWRRWLILFLAYVARHGLPGSQSLIALAYPDRTTNPIRSVIWYDNHFQLEVDTRFWIEWNIFRSGLYEKAIHRFLEQHILMGSTVIDVGANIGAHSLTMSRLVGSQGTVIAIEPHPNVRAKLQQTLRVNEVPNVTVVPTAVGDQDGTVTLRWDDGFASNQGIASLYAKGTAGSVDVPVTTLASIVGEHRIAVIKIDIEGHEFAALRGAESILKRDRPLLVFEYSANWSKLAGTTLEAVSEFFNKLNYSLGTLQEDGQIAALPSPSSELEATIVARPI